MVLFFDYILQCYFNGLWIHTFHKSPKVSKLGCAWVGAWLVPWWCMVMGVMWCWGFISKIKDKTSNRFDRLDIFYKCWYSMRQHIDSCLLLLLTLSKVLCVSKRIEKLPHEKRKWNFFQKWTKSVVHFAPNKLWCIKSR